MRTKHLESTGCGGACTSAHLIKFHGTIFFPQNDSLYNSKRMALMHYPKVGEVLLCDFRGYERPEMIKVRPVVVLIERLIGRSIELITIVPLGGERSDRDFPYQVPLRLAGPLSPKFSKTEVWAKCDMIAVVSRERLDRFRIRPSTDGRTYRWLSGQITRPQLEAIRVGVLHSLGYRVDNRDFPN